VTIPWVAGLSPDGSSIVHEPLDTAGSGAASGERRRRRHLAQADDETDGPDDDAEESGDSAPSRSACPIHGIP
jgi:hypothetical protein